MSRDAEVYAAVLHHLPQVVMVGVSHTIFTSSMFWITLYPVSEL